MCRDLNALGALSALMLATLALTGCAHSQPTLDGDPSREVTLVVDNGNVLDARVFLVRSGLRMRIGTVGAHERRSFTVPRSLLGGIGGFSLESELVASRSRHRTDPVLANPGERIEFWIGHRLSLSRVMVRR